MSCYHRCHRLLLLIFIMAGYLSFGQTASWTAYKPDFFPTNASGQIHGISRVSQMKFHPSNSQKLYAVSARGGLFISSNGGTSWSLAPGCDKMTLGIRFASVCISHGNDQVIYLGTGDHNYYSSGSGIYKSTNGGSTFTATTLTGKIIVDMIMDPADTNVIVAATNTGIYKTINAGATWTLKTTSIAFDDLKKIESSNGRVMFASTRGAELYRSTDFGDTWTQITSGIAIPAPATVGGGTRVALTPADTNVVYVVMNARGATLFKSTDGGLNFTPVKNTILPYLTGYTNDSTDTGQGDYNTGLGVDRTNANIVYFVAHNVWKSTNGGVSWTQLTNWWEKVHTDMHQVCTSPYNNGQLWNMNDGGVWLSNDGGVTWSQKSDGIYGYEIYHGGCSPTRRDMVSIGTQDNGELYASSSGWFTNRGGDWQSHCVFDYRSNSSMVYYFLPDWGTVQLPKRRLVTGSSATYNLPASVTDFTDIAYYRPNPNLAFVGDTILWRTTNLSVSSPTWTNILNTNVRIKAVHVNFADSNKVYVITNDQKIWISTNALAATPTFTTVALPSASGSTASITTIKSSPSVVYIAINNKVYRSADNGSTWTNVSYNLPTTNHIAIIADEYFSGNETVLLATGASVYYKTALATSWTSYSTNLPTRTSIVDMSIYNDGTSNTLLRVFTYGRGVWETPINNLRALTPNFTADNTQICPGQTVNFTDLSTGNVASRSWSFPGGTPSASTAANPAVVYSANGIFPVTLTVSDGTTPQTLTYNSYISTQGKQLPIAEGFEGSEFAPVGWNNIDAGSNAIAWARYSGAGGFGNSGNCMFFDNFSGNAGGAYDEFRTVSLDLSAYNSASLKFDVAYRPYSTTSYIDSFQVLVSTDCGASFTSLYLKSGLNLSTVPSASTTEFVPAADQWRTETINLNSYLGQSVIINFRNIGRYGNNLYVDNININATVAANAGSDKSICSGDSVSIGSSAVSGLTYSWTPATGLSSATAANPKASPATTTTYILTATHLASGIFSKDTVLVQVTPNNGSKSVITATGSYTWPLNGQTYTNSGTYYYSSGCNKDTLQLTINTVSTITLQLKVFIQGYMVSADSMTAALNNSGLSGVASNITDSITVELRNATTGNLSAGPLKLLLSNKGMATVNFNALSGYHYIVLRHRNALEIWSADSLSMSSNLSYDFTNAASKAYGANLAPSGLGTYSMWSGDINQDGMIESADYLMLENDLLSILFGYYNSDINGDGVVESQDYILMDNNLLKILFVARPF